MRRCDAGALRVSRVPRALLQAELQAVVLLAVRWRGDNAAQIAAAAVLKAARQRWGPEYACSGERTHAWALACGAGVQQREAGRSWTLACGARLCGIFAQVEAVSAILMHCRVGRLAVLGRLQLWW